MRDIEPREAERDIEIQSDRQRGPEGEGKKKIGTEKRRDTGTVRERVLV